jgi:tetratricopeptide (TPR) repeat protein
MTNKIIFTSIIISVLGTSLFAQSSNELLSPINQTNEVLLSYTPDETEEEPIKEITPETSGSLCNLGAKQFTQKNYTGAIESYNKALLMDAENANALFNRANANFALKNYKDAERDFSQVILLEPTDKVAFLQRGLVKLELGQFKKAIKDFTAANRLDHYFMQAYLQRGVAKLGNNDFDEAKRDFKLVVKHQPSSEAYLNLALSEMGLGNYSQAKKELTKAIELDQKNAEAYFKRGVAYYDGGSKKNAVKDWEMAFSMGYELAGKALAKYGN